MLLPKILALASKIAAPTVAASVRALAVPNVGQRVWTSGERTHIEVRGVHQPRNELAVRAVQQRLTEHNGVRSSEVNATTGRVVIGHDPEVLGVAKLSRLVTEAEGEAGLETEPPAAGSASYPGNMWPGVREAIALGTNLVGLGYAVLYRTVPRSVLPPAASALVTLVDSAPRMRAAAEAALGRPTADTVFALGGASSQALAQRPIGLVADAGYRFCLYREVSARQRAWQRWEHSVADRPAVQRAAASTIPPRPAAIQDGPIERVSNTSAALAIGGYAAVLAVSRTGQRALAVLIAGIPRPAKVGREAFTAELDTQLSRAGTVVLDPAALRRLDRLDTVVLDEALLLTGRYSVDDAIALDPAVDRSELLQRVHDLVDTRRPETRQEQDGWAILPMRELAVPLPEQARRAVHERAGPGTIMLAVLRESRLVGLVRTIAEIEPLAEAIVEASRQAGSTVLASDSGQVDGRLRLDSILPGGHHLADSLRELQAEGHVVAVLSARNRPALASADVGVGIFDGEDDSYPWGADVVCSGAAQGCVLLHAVDAAHRASRHIAALSVAASSVAFLLAVLGPAQGAIARAAFPIHLGSLLAVAAGSWWGSAPGRVSPPVPVDRTPWHAMSPRTVLARLVTSRDGLDETESERRRRLEPAEVDQAELGLARASMEELANPLTPALVAGAGVSASIGSVADALMITGVLGLNALIGGAQRIGANRELRQLFDTTASRVLLRGGGRRRTALADELVPGDVIEFHAGDAVAADCRILEATGLEVDEASITGESQLVEKTEQATTAPTVADRSSMLYQGSVIAAGRALGVVVATGERTEIGRTSRLADDEAPTTGVEARLQTMTKRTLPVCIGAGVVLLVLDIVRGRGVSQALGRAVSLSVASVPEGLPFVATVAELASARRLSHGGVLVRSPSTIEALGRVNVLCFDKTGTLTEGRISLQYVSDGETDRPVSDLNPAMRGVLAAAVRASPWHEADGPLPHPTDRAVLDGARQQGVHADDGLASLAWVDELRFEPSRGYHAALARSSDDLLLSVKGAPEAVLARCARWRRLGGYTPFDGDARHLLDAEVDRLARQGFRVLAVAERRESDGVMLDDSRVDALDFCGLVALADPIRPTAGGAVDELQRAGVDIVMITGDHPSTAEAIGAELRLLNGRAVMTGAEVDALDDAELSASLPKVAVFARVSPAQKARIVQQLRRAGRVVAMTGDGANDVPAIRFAHVGIALGEKATPAAREVADLVLTDDRIETITDAIVEGRTMWASVRDALSILLGGNLGEIAFTLGAGLFTTQEVLNARQLLLVNLLTDVLPAMAVAVRPPPRATPEELLAEGPEASLGSPLTSDIYARAATTASAAALGFLLARPVSTPAQASTVGLVALVSSQLAQTMVLRGRTPLVVAAALGSVAVLMAIVQIPGASHFFGSRPLRPHQWLVAMGAVGAVSAVELVRQMQPRTRIVRLAVSS